MGRVTYSDFKYWYENNGELQEIFSYKDTLKNYSRLPLHTVDKSIDAIVKRSFEFFSNSFSGNQDLIEAFFMIILLVIKKAMETPDAMKVVCVGGDIQWLSAYIDGILKEMHPDSECVFSNTADDRIDGCILKVVSLLSGGSLPEKNGSTVVAVKGHEKALIDCYTTYDFGMVDVITDYREGAVPEYKLLERSSKAKRNIRTVAAMTPHNRAFNNSELVKDIGLVPYLLYKEEGCKVYLVGLDKNVDYPAKEFVSGTEMVELEGYDLDSKKKWIEEMGHSIDCLMLFGTYDDNIHISKIYRKVNPYGVIYLALDANSYWINNIPRFEKKYDEFYENCDVISTATETLQKFIAAKWKMDIDVVRCGYYPVGVDVVSEPDFVTKKNEIVTVGRIGSKEKRNDILLEAFAKIAGEFPDWTLKLVGPVAENFNEYIDDFFDRNPELKERVIFTGEVTDKKRLHDEFLASKIFALTSDSEGFPNVIPEAKSAGLALALTNIDVAKEAAGYGLSGEVVPTGDTRAYAEALRKLCSDQDSLKEKCKRSFEDYQDKYDYKKIAHELYSVLNRADKKVCTNGPLISVIMPVKNNEKFFPKAVQSILDQEYSNWELIIVEGMSTDKTGVMADDYSKADDRISVIHADEWIYESLNIGISKAKGEYITFLNSDDLLMPDALITAANYLKCFGIDMFLFAVNSTECDENQNILTQDADKVIEFSKEPFVLEGDAECRGAWERIMRAGLLNNQLNVYKKSVIKDVRFRNDIFGADYFFNLQVLPKVRSFAYYPKCLYRFNSYVNVSGMNASVGKYYTYSHSMYNDFYLKSIELFATYGVLDENALSMFRQIRIANFTGELVSYTYDSCKLSLEEKLKEMFAYTNDLRDMLIMEGRFEDIEELALKISYKLISESSEKVEKLVNIKKGVETLFIDNDPDIEAIHRLTFDYYNPAHIGVSRLKNLV
ncbi:MAG: glycosyltransferase [Butyrivibrio sp.]|jgi:glycosyltransferase involved in cell wall biosynthesis|uniref:glycosyltransferase n=1 Tax=Butyrivibrio sp. TaxID=28121 RepID=UPI001EB9DBEF|nr:glycosyltransferase [Butyrivibrio sp.]MBE5839961.1 glycosyltransferase [Butyrivibrio sp.]